MSTTVSIACDHSIGPFDHFWRSTGFTPADWLLQPVMRQTIQYIGAIPHQGVGYARIHFLLDLIDGKNLGSDEPIYDWSKLDSGIDLLLENGIKLFFELMGNPAKHWTDYEDDDQLRAWRRLIADLVRHLQDRYGKEEVRSWYFETWNEPDLPWWKHSQQAFYNYYDACSEGLRDADPTLRFGGPGTCETLHDLFTGLLQHCDTGTNYFTGEQGVRLDFISVHEKGGKWSAEDISPNTQMIIDQTMLAVNHIRAHHPRFADLPFINNECDPLIGWRETHSWRGRPYYAAITCRIIDRHLQQLRDQAKVNFTYLSNDNGFLGRWGQRTQLHCFGDGQGGLNSERFELIKKPVLNVMTMLALQGNERLEAKGIAPGGDVGVFASRRQGQTAILLYASRDRTTSSGVQTIQLQLSGLSSKPLRLCHYRLDDDHGNPFAVWEDAGYPDDPSKDPRTATWPDKPDIGLYDRLRSVHELPLLAAPSDVTAVNGKLELTCELPLHAVSLLLLSEDPGQEPEAVTDLQLDHYLGRTPRQNVMLRWQGLPSRMLLGYEIEAATSPDGEFKKLNTEQDLLACAWLHAREPRAGGLVYRVRAIDYWGRCGGWSEPVTG